MTLKITSDPATQRVIVEHTTETVYVNGAGHGTSLGIRCEYRIEDGVVETWTGSYWRPARLGLLPSGPVLFCDSFDKLEPLIRKEFFKTHNKE